MSPLAPTQLLPANKFYTQWNRHSAVYVAGSDGATYIGWTDETGSTGISRYHHATQAVTSYTLQAKTSGRNGHDSSVMIPLSDGRILAGWANHNAQAFWRITTTPADISSWSAPLTVSGVDPVSYFNAMYLSTPGRYYVHWRRGSGGGPGDRVCTSIQTLDNGASRTGSGDWLTQTGERPYVLSWNDGINKVHFVATNKSQNEAGPDAFFNIYHCYAIFEADGSRTFYKSDGTVIGSSVTRISDQCTLIYDGSTYPAWQWDLKVGADGRPRVLLNQQRTANNHFHMHLWWDGAAWQIEELAEACTTRLYSYEVWAAGGLCFDDQHHDRVYRSAQVGSVWEMQEWRRSGGVWSKFRDITTGSPVGQNAVYPLAPKGATDHLACVWLRGSIAVFSEFEFTVWGVGRA